MLVEGGLAHPGNLGQLFDPQRTGVILADHRNGAGNPGGMAVRHTKAADRRAVAPGQQPVMHLAQQCLAQNRLRDWLIKKPQQSPRRIRYIWVRCLDPHRARADHAEIRFGRERAHQRRIQFQRDRVIGLRRARLQNTAGRRHIGSDQQRLSRAIVEITPRHRHPLAPLQADRDQRLLHLDLQFARSKLAHHPKAPKRRRRIAKPPGMGIRMAAGKVEKAAHHGRLWLWVCPIRQVDRRITQAFAAHLGERGKKWRGSGNPVRPLCPIFLPSAR